MSPPSSASLTIVGTGIQLINDLSHAARTWLTSSQTVLFHVADPLSAEWLQQLNPKAAPLLDSPIQGRRGLAHRRMVERIMAALHRGEQVCAVFYGHPGVYTDPAHLALQAARAAGFPCRLLPAISALGCLLADLAIDPAKGGLQSYEATDFLTVARVIDPHAHLVLWQPAFIDNFNAESGDAGAGLKRLQTRLLADYPPDHRLCLYLAAVYPTQQPHTEWRRLDQLSQAELHPATTLYVAPRVVS